MYMFRSKPSPPPPKTFPEEWRNIPWRHKERDLEIVRHYKPHNELLQLKFLIHGPTGSGKSSFINSVDSVFQGRITGQASTDAISQESYTKEYGTYKIKKGVPGTFYPFLFIDTMGLEEETNRGTNVDDIKLAMKGCMKDGYKFNPLTPISEDDIHYNKDLSLNNKVHVLVCVVAANTLRIMNSKTIKKMREVRLAAQEMGIPQLAILTKIDEACEVVKADLRDTYKSKYIKEQMELLSVWLGFTLSQIFPVKNYHSEIDTNDNTDILILSALKHMVNLGEDYVNRCADS